MILRGKVSSIETGGTRVTFPDKNNAVSSPLQKISSVGLLEVGNRVVVVFFSSNMKDALIIGKY